MLLRDLLASIIPHQHEIKSSARDTIFLNSLLYLTIPLHSKSSVPHQSSNSLHHMFRKPPRAHLSEKLCFQKQVQTCPYPLLEYTFSLLASFTTVHDVHN